MLAYDQLADFIWFYWEIIIHQFSRVVACKQTSNPLWCVELTAGPLTVIDWESWNIICSIKWYVSMHSIYIYNIFLVVTLILANITNVLLVIAIQKISAVVSSYSFHMSVVSIAHRCLLISFIGKNANCTHWSNKNSNEMEHLIWHFFSWSKWYGQSHMFIHHHIETKNQEKNNNNDDNSWSLWSRCYEKWAD